MIRILPALYVASAFLGGFVMLLIAVVSAVPRTRKYSGICIYTFVCLMATLTICAYALLHYCQVLHSKVGSVHFGASKADLVALLGAPTSKYEPAIGPNDKPDPNGAIWYYEIRAFPFETEYRFEFENNKLNGMGGKSYEY